MGRLLVAYSNSANYVATTQQYLAAFSWHSAWDVRYAHVTHKAEIDFDLSEFDAILQSYCVRLPVEGYVPEAWREALKRYRGIKILAVQDEYDHTNRLRDAIREIGFDIVLTCVPPDQIPRVYPPQMFPTTQFVTVMTGYVPEGLDRLSQVRPLSDRPITVGYRGRDISPKYGRLAFDKLDIGRRMKVACREYGVNHDIAWGEGDRLYGNAWYSWIGNCRVNLATESGSNAFDWDGEIEAECRRRNPNVDWADFLEWIAPYEDGFDMGQISPRIFEAAALRTALLLYPGRYSGVLAPNKNYIPLERDFSNIGEVFERIADTAGLQRMVDRTWHDLIGSGRYSHARFVERVDALLDRLVSVRGIRLQEPRTEPDDDMPLVDSPSLRSYGERPTRHPHPPLVFSFKHLAGTNEHLVRALRQQQQLSQALAARINEQREDYEAEIARYRLMVAKHAVKANGHAVELSD